MLISEVYIYNFLFLMGLVNLSIFDLAKLEEEVDLEALEATGVNHNEIH